MIALLILLFLFAYPLVLFPLLLRLLVSLAGRKRGLDPEESSAELPTVALVVCALNEEKVIRAKVENCLALDYPQDRLHIVFVSDGSTDRTAEIVREYESKGVELLVREARRGKVANLNEVVPARSEQIVLLSDANVIYDQNAVKRLVERLADPSVGCAFGRVVLCDTAEAFRSAEQGYYSIEWNVQEWESALYAAVGLDGAMHAFRRELFRPSPNDTLIEDFVLAIQIVRQGKRVVFEPRAAAWETGPSGLREEFRRKVRIAAGAAQCLLRGNGWPFGAPPRFWFLWVSHKFLRWLSPLTALAALTVAAFTNHLLLSRLVLAGSAILLVLAALKYLTGSSHRVFTAPFYFVFGQVAMLWGLLKGAAGRQSVLWAKANR